MDEQELIRMADTRARKIARRRWNCPSDSKVAFYLEQRLEPKEKARFEAHLADCDFCLGIVGALVRQQRAAEPVEVSAHLLHKAIEAVPMKAPRRLPWKWLLAPTLASIVVASAVLLRPPKPGKFVASVSAPTVETARPPAAIPQPQVRPTEKQYVRKLTTSAASLQLVEPRSESVVVREVLRFVWKPIGNAAYYEVQLVDSEGDLVWKEKESEPTAHLPSDLPVRPGRYFVWVHAYLNDGRTVKSEAVPFTIATSR
jgi:hypothetical protein